MIKSVESIEPFRLFLVLGLVGHKVLWEMLRHKSPTPSKTSTKEKSWGLVFLKSGKMLVLAFLLVQALMLEVFPFGDPHSYVWTIGMIIFVLGLTTAVLGRIHLGTSWVDLEEYQVLPTQSMVVDGIYRYIRHPIYTGDLLLLLGLQLALRSWLVLGVLAFVVIVYRQAFQEEQILMKAFPPYQEYCRRTKRFIPFLV